MLWMGTGCLCPRQLRLFPLSLLPRPAGRHLSLAERNLLPGTQPGLPSAQAVLAVRGQSATTRLLVGQARGDPPSKQLSDQFGEANITALRCVSVNAAKRLLAGSHEVAIQPCAAGGCHRRL
jgi:hypothetical protein